MSLLLGAADRVRPAVGRSRVRRDAGLRRQPDAAAAPGRAGLGAVCRRDLLRAPRRRSRTATSAFARSRSTSWRTQAEGEVAARRSSTTSRTSFSTCATSRRRAAGTASSCPTPRRRRRRDLPGAARPRRHRSREAIGRTGARGRRRGTRRRRGHLRGVPVRPDPRSISARTTMFPDGGSAQGDREMTIAELRARRTRPQAGAVRRTTELIDDPRSSRSRSPAWCSA